MIVGGAPILIEDDVLSEAEAAEPGLPNLSAFTVQLTRSKDDVEPQMVCSYREFCRVRYADPTSTLRQFANATERGREKPEGLKRNWSGQNQLRAQAFEAHLPPANKSSSDRIKASIIKFVKERVGEPTCFAGYRLEVKPLSRNQAVTHSDHGGMLGHAQKGSQLGHQTHYSFQCGGLAPQQCESARRSREKPQRSPDSSRIVLKPFQLLPVATRCATSACAQRPLKIVLDS